jgi:hypothetical protein
MAARTYTGRHFLFHSKQPIAKPTSSVTQAKAGNQKIVKRLDAVFRRYDVQGLLQLAQDSKLIS